MRCDICGAEVPQDQVTYDTRNERIGNMHPVIPMARPLLKWGRKGSAKRRRLERRDSVVTMKIALCPACAEQRASTRQVWVWSMVGLIIVGLAIVVIGFLTAH
jgi:hypothetical protein